jgi:hypothetical protein
MSEPTALVIEVRLRNLWMFRLVTWTRNEHVLRWVLTRLVVPEFRAKESRRWRYLGPIEVTRC